MRKYYDPELETILFDVEDVTNTDFGGGDGDDNEGSFDDMESVNSAGKFLKAW